MKKCREQLLTVMLISSSRRIEIETSESEGPLAITDYTPPLALDNRIYIHTTHHLTFSKISHTKARLLRRDPSEPFRDITQFYVIDSSYNYVREYGNFLHQVEAYLRGYPNSRMVQVPAELSVHPFRLPNTQYNFLYLSFPLVEKSLGNLAARSSSTRLGQTCSILP